MLARVTSGKSGIVNYLVNGFKSDRKLSRDELDYRVVIDGNLTITDEVIKQVNQAHNYLHITLSFREKELNEATIIEAYNGYKELLMKAYHSDEYNIYAEIHYPKIKSYSDKKTGETIERLPHVHMVIPQKNLVTDKSLNPFGRYTSNIEYHDSIQEAINRSHHLESPYDHQRKYRIVHDNAEFISRYKGDHFKGSRAEFKHQIFDLINDQNIRTLSEFEKVLSNYGQVSKGSAGSADEYFKIKLHGESKNIRLKEAVFKPAYIIDRQLLRAKPTDQQVDKLVNEWIATRSHEMKHIHPASPKLRDTYYGLEPQQQQEYLDEHRKIYNEKYHLGTQRRTTNRKPGPQSVGLRRFTDIRDGLPDMPKRGLVRTNRERPEVSKGVLPNHEYHHLESTRANRDHQLRRATYRSRDYHRIGLPQPHNALKTIIPEAVKPKTPAEHFLQTHLNHQLATKERAYLRTVKKKLDPERLLKYFEKTHGLVRANYSTFKAKDGSARIKIGSKAFNVSDFSTKHMCQSWEDTKAILNKVYGEQRTEDQDKYLINSISFVSQYVTQAYTSQAKLLRLEESIAILKYLQQQEKYGDSMPLADLEKHRFKDEYLDVNSIANAEISLLQSTDHFKRQQAIAKQLSMKMGDVVPIRDIKNKQVIFKDKNSGDKMFKDTGDTLIMAKRKPQLEHVAAAMTLAAEKFGCVKITGTKAFKQQVIDIAIAKNLKIVFESSEMQALFVNQKEAAKLESKPKIFDLNYHKTHDEYKTNVTINGKQPDQVPVSTLEKIIKNDKFLSHYSLPEVQSGTLDLNKSKEIQPEPRQLNEQGETYIHKNSDLDENQATASQDNTEPNQPAELISFGSAPYLNDKKNTDSYYVNLSNGKTFWGVGLKKAIEDSGAQIGDKVNINKLGTEKVQVNVDIKDSQGKVIGRLSKTP